MKLLNDIFLDGQIFTQDAEGLQGLTVTYEEKENIIGYSLSSEIKFTHTAYNYLYSIFFADACAGRDAEVSVTLVVRTCCADNPISFSAKITFETIEHSKEDCIIYAKLLSNNACQDNYNWFKDRSWFKHGFKDAYRSPKSWYCIQTENFLLWAWVIGVLFPLLLAWQILEEVLQILVKALLKLDDFINVLSNTQEAALEAFSESSIFFSFDDILKRMAGCGNYHYSPYYSEILAHNIAKSNEVSDCELTLDAPFLDEQPYSELAIFMSQSGEGDECNTAGDVTARLNEDNAWNVTTLEIINKIAKVFNHRAVFLPIGQLHIDTYENLVNKAPTIATVETEYHRDKLPEPPKYKYDVGKYCFASEYSYTDDAKDLEGQRNLANEYSEAVIWDEDGGENRDGVCKKVFEFGPLRAMYDRHTFKLVGLFDFDKLIDDLRNVKNIWGFALKILDGACYPRRNDIILSKHQTELPKLILLKPDTDRDDAKLQIDFGPDPFHYNHPLHLKYDTETPELINRFHITDDPAHPDHRLMELAPFTFNLTADILDTIKDYGSFITVNTIYGIGMPNKVTLDFANCTITVSGVKLKCSLV